MSEAVGRIRYESLQNIRDICEDDKNFWADVVLSETWINQGNTKEEAIAAANHFEGKYDMCLELMAMMEVSDD